jgi:hypothetical protein
MTRAYDELIDFIVGGPTTKDVASFEPSEAVRQRVWDLIGRSKTSTLSEEERAELEKYLQLEHIMRVAKARARGRIAHE